MGLFGYSKPGIALKSISGDAGIEGNAQEKRAGEGGSERDSTSILSLQRRVHVSCRKVGASESCLGG